MLAGFLAGLLKWLSKGVLESVFKHLETQAKNQTDREKLKTEITIETIRNELARRQQAADLIKSSLSHRIMWFPAFVICLATAVLYVAHVVDAVWQLPGNVSELSPSMVGVFGMALGFMFLREK